jgi:ABC-type dipeptide/oligopeptide/nickel transport system permease component/ABC-type transport system substrate-binding protein
MSRAKDFLTYVGVLFAAGVFLFGLLYVFAWFFRPNIFAERTFPDPAELAAVEASRDISFNAELAPFLHREVDYAEGEMGSWYPKGESPFLAELVSEGLLDPVAERVGPEPAVLEGVDGIGNFGGTWYRVANSEGDVGTISWRLSGGTLLRWSPLGYPLKPHLAMSYEASEDFTEYTVRLRQGVRWSDGAPFTAQDILYWWEDHNRYFDIRPLQMTVAGQLGDIEMIDDYTVRFTFPRPFGLFPEQMAKDEFWAPAHYLRPFHPELGDPEKIAAMLRVQGVASPRAAYFRLTNFRNPEYPRLWPWVPRTYQSTPPYEFVRNPYYWVVDPAGNQLPYVDRVLFDIRSEGMISVTAASGDITMQLRHLRYDDYTLYMDQRKRSGYDVYHWFQGSRSTFVVFPNLNRRIDPERPETKLKHELLNDKRFRQALSLAINREEIIKAEYHGETTPAQLDPGPESFFHHPEFFASFTDYDPERANALLDEIGLTQRDREGFRTFLDGTRMTWNLHVTDFTGTGPSAFLTDYWAAVGVRMILQERARSLWQRQQSGLEHDFTVWSGESEFYPLVEPRNFVPMRPHSFFAPGFAHWYQLGGLAGNADLADRPLAMEPPVGHPLRRTMEILEEALAAGTREQQREIFSEVFDIAAENVWSINISTPPPQVVVVKNGFRNVPRNAIVGHIFSTPANTGIETYFFDQPFDSAGAIAAMKSSMIQVRPDPTMSLAGGGRVTDEGGAGGNRVGSILRFLVYGTLLVGGVMVAVKHPFVGRRFVILIPTLLVISVATYVIIQLPPGDFIEARIIQLEMEGDDSAIQEVIELRSLFHLDESVVARYFRWMGVHWFTTFESSDRGLLQGSLGRSMEDTRRVNDVVGDRILLTFMISLFTIIFTWMMAVPIGIYSAVRQYSVGDYVFTLIGFIGMCIPNFLLALILMYVSGSVFGAQISGLFSAEYAAQPEWTWGKFVDLLKHIWVPVVVLGTAGTAWMIRVMRGNLLDELRKPYVVTARAKGVRPMKLLFKYPVRLALNPFISGIGTIFPQMVSGGAIVAIVLSLPTVGPLLLSSLMTQDMYLAGSLLMVLSLLTVFGTLVSDLLLMWLDPRIRMGGGGR